MNKKLIYARQENITAYQISYISIKALYIYIKSRNNITIYIVFL